MDNLILQKPFYTIVLSMQAKNVNTPISSREMRAIEINSEYYGISLLQLMENAGRNVAQEIQKRFSNTKKVTFFCGLGGNGGDGFVAARHLLAQGYSVKVILAGKSKDIQHPSAVQNWNALKPVTDTASVVEVIDSSDIPVLVETDVIVDALLGTGVKGKLKAPILQMVNVINSLEGFKLAVDVPTGLDSDTGKVLNCAVKADLTVTFYRSKLGLETAKAFVGFLEVRDIGLPLEFERFTGPGDVGLAVKPRLLGLHKGDSGRLLVVGGSNVFSGAPTLASIAALRTGVDVVYTASPEKTAHDISSMSADLISIKLSGDDINSDNAVELDSYLAMVDGVVLGPGLGLKSESVEFVKLFIDKVEKAGKALLLDADGLKAFAKFKRPLSVPLVLTPHESEFALLSGQKLPKDLEGKIDLIQKVAKELKAILLVKGQVDIICSSDRVKTNITGNAGMTVGGTGDVLSGIVGGLLAQKVFAFEAAAAGAFVNGACGDFAASETGAYLLATDLLDWIPQVLMDPMSHLKVREQ
ncbi:MAG: NAD(P)H-hydrate dehydratase [Nitrososphaerota archaeon]|jgi:NAD(P)H-hydrate epimerase|nr:NAD(P)H-hydrate dehydratase [Nitrososphaerota archaeon]